MRSGAATTVRWHRLGTWTSTDRGFLAPRTAALTLVQLTTQAPLGRGPDVEPVSPPKLAIVELYDV